MLWKMFNEESYHWRVKSKCFRHKLVFWNGFMICLENQVNYDIVHFELFFPSLPGKERASKNCKRLDAGSNCPFAVASD